MKKPKLFSMSGTSTLTASLVAECSALLLLHNLIHVSRHAMLTSRLGYQGYMTLAFLTASLNSCVMLILFISK
jgi:hypothetical protein